LFLASFINGASQTWFVVLCLIILGIGFGLFSSPNTNAVMSSVDRRFYGVTSDTVGTMRLVGQMLSLGITTLVFVLYLGRVKIVPANYLMFLSSVRTLFVIFASLSRGKVRQT